MQILFMSGGRTDLVVNSDYVVSIFRDGRMVYIDYAGAGTYNSIENYGKNLPRIYCVMFRDSEAAQAFIELYGNFSARGEKLLKVRNVEELSSEPFDVPF